MLCCTFIQKDDILISLNLRVCNHPSILSPSRHPILLNSLHNFPENIGGGRRGVVSLRTATLGTTWAVNRTGEPKEE